MTKAVNSCREKKKLCASFLLSYSSKRASSDFQSIACGLSGSDELQTDKNIIFERHEIPCFPLNFL